MLTLNNLSSPSGSNKKTKRIGRGQGSGWGTQAGKGHKGQKARSGGGVRTGFEGGSMPLYMRLPKRGFSNAPFSREFATVTLGNITAKFEKGSTICREGLISAGLLSGKNKRLPIKILFTDGSSEKALTFSGISKFTKNVTKWIENSGSKVL
ncbi:MAG: 50S ribosomal protein L15 [Halobacteriovoraceae bacterium]|nr:50S ribosomal protein L15 [Halobacteriovoraceae bacterium]